MRIAFLIKDQGALDKDFTCPDLGNPGVGGTLYCYVTLCYYLNKYTDWDIIAYHFEKSNKVLPTVTEVIVNSFDMAVKDAKNREVDIFVCTYHESSIFEILEREKIFTVVWIHNYLGSKEMDMLNRYIFIKRVVFVGRQLYDTCLDHELVTKSTYIYNMFNSKLYSGQRDEKIFDNPMVVYTGSLVFQKGFHILAKAWPEILRKVPNAQLYVIGSGQLYNSYAELGKYNIAEEKYEKMFMPYLVDENGKILESVHFCGVVGNEKTSIYQNATVGIVNPSALTETFGLSGVEMQAHGIPVVTKRAYGLIDTVKNNESGLTYMFEWQLSGKVISLLLNKEKNLKLGMLAKKFVEDSFSPDLLIMEWIQLFQNVKNRIPAVYHRPTGNWLNSYKGLIVVNRYIKSYRIFSRLPSILRIKLWGSEQKRKLKVVLNCKMNR